MYGITYITLRRLCFCECFNAKAIEEAKANAVLNEIKNCDFVSASSEEIFKSKDPVKVGDTDNNEDPLLVKDFPRDNTVVITDPPRKGCSEEFLQQLDKYRPARVVYMSCDPATQARDTAFLVSHGYSIVSIQPFDLFPQTRHIECLAVFDRPFGKSRVERVHWGGAMALQ